MDEIKSYFAMRSVQEQAAADRAADPLSQSIHLDLALRYQQLAEADEEAEVPEVSSEGRRVSFFKGWRGRTD